MNQIELSQLLLAILPALIVGMVAFYFLVPTTKTKRTEEISYYIVKPKKQRFRLNYKRTRE